MIEWQPNLKLLTNDRHQLERLKKQGIEDREKMKALAELALEDELTKLPNYRAFQEALNHQYAATLRENHDVSEDAERARYSIIAFDLDGLKVVNDTHGHDAGDEFLRGVADKVKTVLRPLDLFARKGGDEFVLILPNTDEEEARLVGERILKVIHDDVTKVLREKYKDDQIQVSASIGVAAFSRDPKTGEFPDASTLVTQADRTSYIAKHKGKNLVVSLSETERYDADGRIREAYSKVIPRSSAAR